MHRRIIALVVAVASLTLWAPAAPAQAVSPGSGWVPVASTADYLAVGDSIPAGVGVGEDHAYPAVLDLLGRRFDLVDNLAVSGATVADVATQLAAVPDAGRAAVRRISITIGANDVGWVSTLLACVNQPAGTECAKTVVDPTTQATLEQVVGARLSVLAATLPAMLVQAHRLFPNATFYVSSYYRLLGSKAKACTVAPGYTVSLVDKTWLNELADQLNATIRSSVASANGTTGMRVARYVNAARLFVGHGFCDRSTRWLFGPVEVALGVDPDAIAHPNLRGQAAYALAFLKAGIA